ncbi:MAG TPA: ribonuclease activity regulator RraA [Rhodospirillales bacterium]
MLDLDDSRTTDREPLPMDKKPLEALRKISVATVTMQLLKRGIRNVSMAGVKPLNRPVKPVVGPAYTLRYVPLREDKSAPEVLGRPDYPPRLAIEQAPAGSVLVIDGRGRGDIAVVGDILVERLKIRGVAAMVSDGGIRDCAEALKSDLPLYAAGPAAPASIGGHSAADIGTPVACGGVAVFPGDIICADGDGVVVVPQALAADVARDGLEQERYERFAKMKIKEGRKVPGVYPPNAETKAEYETWVKKGEPES